MFSYYTVEKSIFLAPYSFTCFTLYVGWQLMLGWCKHLGIIITTAKQLTTSITTAKQLTTSITTAGVITSTLYIKEITLGYPITNAKSGMHVVSVSIFMSTKPQITVCPRGVWRYIYTCATLSGFLSWVSLTLEMYVRMVQYCLLLHVTSISQYSTCVFFMCKHLNSGLNTIGCYTLQR